jgi:UDP-N-acetylmuramoylalanine--D-glutamate ligase
MGFLYEESGMTNLDLAVRRQHYTPAGPGALAPRTLIVGLGKTGLSCARFLAPRGVPLAVTDSRAAPPALAALRDELPDVAVFVGGFNEAAFAAAEQFVVSPGISLNEPVIARARRRGVPVVGDIELFARAADAPIIAITGSNGKSTVTTLVGEMARCAGLKAAVGGNLGTPALDLLMDPEGPPDLYVIEVSSFQLDTTENLGAAAAVVLNVSPDHMDRYPDLETYCASKQRVYRGAGVKVINADDPLVAEMGRGDPRALRFTLGEPGPGELGLMIEGGEEWLAFGSRLLLPAREVRIAGRHNLANALAAMALSHAMRLPWEAMCEALRRFPGLPHRCEWVAERDGVTWYNDSKGTNVGATVAAMQGMLGRLVLIAGGDGKGADFKPLGPVVAQKARAVVLIGRDARIIEKSIEQAIAGAAPVVHAKDMLEAVDRARELAQPGDSVLLSPACASFDMFKNFEHRGRVFVSAVRAKLGIKLGIRIGSPIGTKIGSGGARE